MRKVNIEQREKMAAHMAEVMTNMFRKEHPSYIGEELEDMNPNDLFTAFLLAEYFVYRRLTGYETDDLIDYTHLQNKLATAHTLAMMAREIEKGAPSQTELEAQEMDAEGAAQNPPPIEEEKQGDE